MTVRLGKEVTLRLVCAWMAMCVCRSCVPQEPPPDLYSQSAAALIDRSFPSAKVEYLLLDVSTRQTIAVRWGNPEEAIPVGSLLKPFVALAYGEMQGNAKRGGSEASSQFPVIRCSGKADGCWRTGGHGSLTLEQALGRSCNAYFLQLAGDVSLSGMDVLNRVRSRYGLPAAPDAATSQILIGMTPEWRIAPMALANAYAQLASQSQDELIRRLLYGMRLATQSKGTAYGVGRHPGGILAKTGTAPCRAPSSGSTKCIASGDGLVVLLAPSERPQRLLLVRVRGTTGAQAAVVAGRMLSQLEAVRAVSH